MKKILHSRTFWTILILGGGIAGYFLAPYNAGGSLPNPLNPAIALFFFLFLLYFSQYSEINSALSNANYSKAIEIAERFKKTDPKTFYSVYACA
jgi:hypothetical protein